MTNVKNSKNSEYYEKVIKELKERCQARDEVFEYDVERTREKFKRCIGICQDAAMKTTASGITRFQEDKKYGTWFNKLFNVMKSTARAICTTRLPELWQQQWIEGGGGGGEGYKLEFINKFWKTRKSE